MPITHVTIILTYVKVSLYVYVLMCAYCMYKLYVPMHEYLTIYIYIYTHSYSLYKCGYTGVTNVYMFYICYSWDGDKQNLDLPVCITHTHQIDNTVEFELNTFFKTMYSSLYAPFTPEQIPWMCQIT